MKTARPTPTHTISLTAASVTTSPGVRGSVVVQASGVSEAELLQAVATQCDLDAVIDALGEDNVADALQARNLERK